MNLTNCMIENFGGEVMNIDIFRHDDNWQDRR